jgi:hypothetical protein
MILLEKLTRRKALLLAALLLSLTQIAWALASPPGSSPDEFYHIGSAWCINGESDTCRFSNTSTDYYPLWAEVPYSGDPCFEASTSIGGSCIPQDAPTVQQVPIDNSVRIYPRHYYLIMHQFLRLGPDLGIPLLRFFNALIGVLILVLALLISDERTRPAVISGFVLLSVPQGLFIITSVNPSSWVFTGVTFSWVFLHWLLTNWRTSPKRTYYSVAAIFALTLFLSSARYDSLMYAITVNLGAFFLFRKRGSRNGGSKPLILLIIFSSLGGMFIARARVEYVFDNLKKMLTLPEFFAFARYWFLHFVEIPLTSFGLNYGNYGPTGVITPPIVGHIQFGFLIGSVLMAVIVPSKRQLLLAGGTGLFVFLAILQQVSIDGETGFYMVQGRYFFPLIIAALGIFVALSNSTVQLVQVKSIRTLLTFGLSFSHLLTFFVFVRRYSTGYDNDYRRFELDVFKEFGLPTGWSYLDGVSPVALIIIGSLTYAVFISILLKISDNDFKETSTCTTTRNNSFW